MSNVQIRLDYSDAWGAWGSYDYGAGYASGSVTARTVEGRGAYQYRQGVNGDIWILRGAYPPGRSAHIKADPSDRVWVAITREIGAIGRWRGDPRLAAPASQPRSFSADAPTEIATLSRGDRLAAGISTLFGLTREGARTYAQVRRIAGGAPASAQMPPMEALPPPRPAIPIWIFAAGGAAVLLAVILLSRGGK